MLRLWDDLWTLRFSFALWFTFALLSCCPISVFWGQRTQLFQKWKCQVAWEQIVEYLAVFFPLLFGLLCMVSLTLFRTTKHRWRKMHLIHWVLFLLGTGCLLILKKSVTFGCKSSTKSLLTFACGSLMPATNLLESFKLWKGNKKKTCMEKTEWTTQKSNLKYGNSSGSLML